MHFRRLDPRRIVLVDRLAPYLVHVSRLASDLVALVLGYVSREGRLDLDAVQSHLDVLLIKRPDIGRGLYKWIETLVNQMNDVSMKARKCLLVRREFLRERCFDLDFVQSHVDVLLIKVPRNWGRPKRKRTFFQYRRQQSLMCLRGVPLSGVELNLAAVPMWFSSGVPKFGGA